jgi:hypothetical protein
MERIMLEPVDGVEVTTVVDNSSDVLMPDEGLVRRWGPVGTAGEIPVIPTELAEGGKTVDFLRAEHGFSEPVRDPGCRVRDHRGPSAVVPARRGAAGHWRGGPDYRVRDRVSDSSGLARGRLGARPADP